MADNKDFILFDDQKEYVDLMTDQQAGQLLKALYAHNRGEDVQVQDPMVTMAFMMFWKAIEQGRVKRAKLRENAAKGGRPKSNPEPEKNQDETKPKPNNNQNKTKEEPKPKQSADDLDLDLKLDILTPLSPTEMSPPLGGGRKAKETIKSVLSEQHKDLIPDLQQFIEHRTRIKKPLTPYALRLSIGELQRLAPGDIAHQKAIIEETIKSGWQGFFPLKADRQTGYFTDAERRTQQNKAVCRQVSAELDAIDSPF